MRKVLSLLLCVAMLCSLVVITAQADAEAPAASFASVAAIPGGTVTIDMKVLNNPGIATLKFVITETTEGEKLAPTFAGADNGADSLGLTANDPAATYWWSGAYDVTTETVGTLTITIPSSAKTGTYTFAVAASQAVNTSNQDIAIADTTFTITVADKAITGVNLAINAGIAVGVHVLFANSEDYATTSITAVNVDGKEYTTVANCEEGDIDNEYVYYVNVTPWTVGVDFLVDFTDNFVFEDDKLDLEQLPATAKETGVLSYCEAILATSPTNKLKKVLADLLEYCRQVQIYKGETPLTMPTGLKATAINYETLTGYCEDEEVPASSLTAGKKASEASFDNVVLTFGAGVVATFNIDTDIDSDNLRMRVAGTKVYELDNKSFSYTYSPSECPLDIDSFVKFELYTSPTSTKAADRAYTNQYSLLNYVAYLIENEKVDDAEDVLTVLAAYYNYAASVAAYN